MAFTTDNFNFKKVATKLPTNSSLNIENKQYNVQLNRYIFKSEETGFYVASVKVPVDYPILNETIGNKKLIGRDLVITGTSIYVVENVKEGQEINIFGNFEIGKLNQIQFKVNNLKEIIPTKPKAIQMFLASGKIKGIGPATAKKIVDKFGSKTIEIFDKSPNMLKQISGMSDKKLEKAIESWTFFRNIYEIMSTMQYYGVGDANGAKIYQHFKEKALQIIKTDPYRLTEVPNVGFRTADKIAQSIGISPVDPQRIKYCILYTLEKLAEEGNTAYIKDDLAKKVNEDLNIDPALIEGQIELLINNKEVVLKNIFTKKIGIKNNVVEQTFECVAHKKFDYLEKKISSEILRISQMVSGNEDFNKIQTFLDKNDDQLDDSQKSAATKILSSKMAVLTGGPGTGKTHTIKSILQYFKKQGFKCVLAAPTGRAAKRMEEATGFSSSTIHRLLGFKEGKFVHNENNQLDGDVFIIDESSMIDVYLACGLLRALPNKAKIVLVGDIDQLPSVGAGNVLQDIIDSGKIPVARLQVIHRQAQGSDIIKASHQIIKNELPDCVKNNKYDNDFVLKECETNEEIEKNIQNLVNNLINKGLFKNDEIQIITPKKDGVTGVDSLNVCLRSILNPKYIETENHKVRFFEGDRVMQYKNNYDLDIFNGDVGKVIEYDPEEQSVLVNFDNNYVSLTGNELNELKLANAITIHKSQGSDYPCVIIPMSKSHTFMWDSKLLYTALTRGKKQVFIVGDKKTLFYSVAKFKQNFRTTSLKEEIINAWDIYNNQLNKSIKFN